MFDKQKPGLNEKHGKELAENTNIVNYKFN